MTDMICNGGTAHRRACGQRLHVEREWDRDPATAIRCADCGALMCPRCAREHFAESDARRREVRAVVLEEAAVICDGYGREGDRFYKEHASETADELAARIRAAKGSDGSPPVTLADLDRWAVEYSATLTDPDAQAAGGHFVGWVREKVKEAGR